MNYREMLGAGLERTFDGRSDVEKLMRGRFIIYSSQHLPPGDTAAYIDQWVTGGGQELAMDSDGNGITRTYVGNVIEAEKLSELGITEAKIMEFLAAIIAEHGNETRFDTDFQCVQENWTYQYRVTYQLEDPFIINGLEKIRYRGEVVFVHTFGISKITEG